MEKPKYVQPSIELSQEDAIAANVAYSEELKSWEAAQKNQILNKNNK